MAAASRQDSTDCLTPVSQTGVGSQAHAVTARRTRTMTTEGTQEFQALSAEDVASFNDVTSKAPADLGVQAQGVSRLSHASERQLDDGRMPRAFLIAGVLLAVAVVIGGFFLFRAAIKSIDGSASSVESAVYAVDDFSLIARVDDGSLNCVYLAYVDSINGRCELCYVDGASRLSDPSGSPGKSLADLWSSEGLDGLAKSISQAGGIEVKTAMEASGDEVAQILEIAQGDAADVSIDSLVAQVMSKPGQMISAGALRGLLVTMGDVGDEGYIMLNAPTETLQQDMLAYQQIKGADWSIMLAGMRDSASSVTTGL